MTSRISKDTRLCISLAGRPSNIGTRFHNYLYDELGLDFSTRRSPPPTSPPRSAGCAALGIRGCSVSMPFKEDVHLLVDAIPIRRGPSSAVNTIVND